MQDKGTFKYVGSREQYKNFISYLYMVIRKISLSIRQTEIIYSIYMCVSK